MKAIIAIPATLALMYRAWSHKSLTPGGIFAAGITAAAHAYHPWNLPFVLLVVFFLAGTRVTKIKKDIKATVTVASNGGTTGGEGPRTHVQVFANSIVASVLSVLHAYQLNQRRKAFLDASVPNPTGSFCYSWGGDLLVVGIIANYAAVAADTFSSELGILSMSQPRLITSPTFRRVPPGTNGGVTPMGIAAGFFGSLLIVTASMLFLPLCDDATNRSLGDAAGAWAKERRRVFMGGLVLWGTLGSLLDSVLGGLFQRSVKDVRSGKIVEGHGGTRVLISSESETRKRVALEAATLHGEGKDAVEDMDATKTAARRKKSGGHDRYDPQDKHRVSSFGDERPTRVVESGWNLLDNNDVNFLMALTMSVGAMAIAGRYWGIPLDSILTV